MGTNGTNTDRIEIRVLRWIRIIRDAQEFFCGYVNSSRASPNAEPSNRRTRVNSARDRAQFHQAPQSEWCYGETQLAIGNSEGYLFGISIRYVPDDRAYLSA